MTYPKSDHRDPVAASKLAAFYRDKAAECLGLAGAAPDQTTRDHWTEMANGWTQLALHYERSSQDESPG
jgi:hypothetical protein